MGSSCWRLGTKCSKQPKAISCSRVRRFTASVARSSRLRTKFSANLKQRRAQVPRHSARSRASPARGLVVGITGHRPNRIPTHAIERIKRQLAEVLTDIETSNPGRQPMLLSGLAEGADRLAAFVALGRGWPLRAILPFHRSRFEEDFPDPYAIGEFRAMLEASSTLEEPGRIAHLGKPAERGYVAVGERLLALSDMLIAVWDGKASRGKGGTVE